MKNIQFIDGAENSAYDVFQSSEDDFQVIYPQSGQDVEFIEDLIERLGDAAAGVIVSRISGNPIRKPDVSGIHGTLFIGLASRRHFYPNKRESDLDHDGRGWSHG